MDNMNVHPVEWQLILDVHVHTKLVYHVHNDNLKNKQIFQLKGYKINVHHLHPLDGEPTFIFYSI
jgi:hypothetical protein